MSELIKRAELLAQLDECLAESDGHTPIVDGVLMAVKSAVEKMPTVDAVPVVRCKDCKWFYESDTVICCEKHTGLALARKDDYCSYGERRKDD